MRFGISQFIFCGENELFSGQSFHFIVLVLKIDDAIIILERPGEGEAIVVAGSIGLEDHEIIFILAIYMGIEGIEAGPSLIFIRIFFFCGESRLFVFPGGTGEKLYLTRSGIGRLAGGQQE